MLYQNLEWDVDAINDIFEQRDENLILSIPLPAIATQDKVIWAHEEDGRFSMKSCYKALTVEFPNTNMSKWLACWKLKVPPNIKLSFWQACVGCTPTTDALRKRNIDCNPICQLRERDDETLMHLMYDCVLARTVWSLFLVPIPYPNHRNFAELATEIYDQLSKHHMDLFITYYWSIWGARNEKV